jgi:lipoyl(octanoyl) transferase
VAWFESPGLVPYPEAVASMEERVAAIRSGAAPETVWLLQHPPVYTAGTSARGSDLIDPGRFPVYRSGRGGRYTYHGPGQRVAYVMLDLRRRGSDVRAFVAQLESWVIASLARFGVTGERRAGRIGIWVGPDGADAKIAAIGVRIRGWVTYHGVAVNVSPDLGHFSGIVPCGLADRPVTSLHALGVRVGLDAIDAALRATFAACFPPPQ